MRIAKMLALLLFFNSQLIAQEYLPDQILIRFKPGFPDQTASVEGLGNLRPAYPFLQAARFKRAGEPAWERAANTLIADLPPGTNVEVLAAKLSRRSDIELAEPVWIAQTMNVPNDPLYTEQQDYLGFIGAVQAWATASGSASVVIAISDTGTEYTHPDLAANAWKNPGESGSGRESNGIDDDGNGFIDDVSGWDFAENDNTPLPGSSGHGTHVAGIAAAVTGNGTGIASLSRNVRFMTLRAGTQSIPFGIPSVLYAAANGAKIINCSWGSVRYSKALHEAVLAAHAAGALVIGAAGNEGSSRIYYPAGLPEALGVAATNNAAPSRAVFSNFNPTVDIAAPGANIYSTLLNGTYGFSGGTSMAAPVVSALAALIRSRNPDWSMDQVRANLLWATKPIPAAAHSSDHLLGQGYVWAPDALSTARSSLSIENARFSDGRASKPDGVFESGEPLDLALTLRNSGPAASYSFQFSSSSTTQLSAVTQTLGPVSFGAGESRTLPVVQLQAGIGAGTSAAPVVYVDATGSGVTKRLTAQTVLNPSYGTLSAGAIELSLSALGRIGPVNPASAVSEGSAFIVRTPGSTSEALFNTPLLAEGSFVIASSAQGSPVSDAARGTTGFQQDFTVRRPFKGRDAGDLSYQTGAVEFADDPQRGLGLLFNAHMAAWRATADENYVVVGLTITNGPAERTNLRAGLYLDFDLPLAQATDDRVFYDAAADLTWQTSTGTNAPLAVGAAVYGGSGGGWLIKNNSTSSSFDFGVDDGFTEEEKRMALFFGPGLEDIGPDDVSFMVPSKTFSLAPNASHTVWFILAQGPNRQSLLQSIQAAQARIAAGVPLNAGPVDRPAAFELTSVFPNPFNPTASVEMQLDGRAFTLDLLDLNGRVVHRLASGRGQSGRRQVHLAAGSLASGVYLLRLTDGAGASQVRKITLLK